MIDALDAMLDLDHPIKIAARDWATANLDDGPTMQERGVVDKRDWATVGARGLLGSHVPIELGGLGIGAVESALIYEGLGASSADNGVVFAVASQAIAVVKAVAATASPHQRERWFPRLVDGSTFASLAMSEREAGSDPWSMTTTATKQSDGTWFLNGAKAWCSLGPVCDVAIVFAVTDPDKGQWGITAFMVSADSDGFERGPAIDKTGLQSCPFGDIRFVDCRVGDDARLGHEGAGAAIFTKVTEQERAFLYAAQIGAIERVLDSAVDYARRRVQGGVHIGTHQAVAHRLVEVKAAHEAARLALYKAAACVDRAMPIGMAAALTKLATAETAVAAMVDAIKTFGALGLTTELGLERELRDSLAGLAFSGTPDLGRNLVAAHLGLNRRAR